MEGLSVPEKLIFDGVHQNTLQEKISKIKIAAAGTCFLANLHALKHV